MDRARPRHLSLLGVLLLSVSACSTLMASRDPSPVVKPVGPRELTILPVEVTLRNADASPRKAALVRELDSAIASSLGTRATRLTAASDRDADVARIQQAFASSKIFIYRELVGYRKFRDRPQFAANEIRELADATGADAILVVQFVGSDLSPSAHVAESAASLVRDTAFAALALSPTRLVKTAFTAGNTLSASELRIALVDGTTGEVLWANWVRAKRPASPEMVGALVRMAMTKFPPPAPTVPYTTISSR